MDNCSAHETKSNLPELNNIKVQFLPKKTTSILQLLDLGVISVIKRNYRARVAARAVDLVNSGSAGDPYKIDIRMAGAWVYEMWTRVANDTICNCWRKSNIV